MKIVLKSTDTLTALLKVQGAHRLEASAVISALKAGMDKGLPFSVGASESPNSSTTVMKLDFAQSNLADGEELSVNVELILEEIARWHGVERSAVSLLLNGR